LLSFASASGNETAMTKTPATIQDHRVNTLPNTVCRFISLLQVSSVIYPARIGLKREVGLAPCVPFLM